MYEDYELIDNDYGLIVKIGIDIIHDDMNDPRSWDNLGIMYCWHPDYELGDHQFSRGEFNNFEEVIDSIKDEGGICILPLCVYEHSGITMYVGQKGDYPFDAAGWDTTACGFIYTTHDKVNKHFGLTNASEENIEEILRQEVSVYASYLEGQIYYYTVEDKDDTFFESCGGFIGDYDHVKSEALKAAARVAEQVKKENSESENWKNRGVITR